ncbi:MAG TPA: thioredoxin family protein [Gemmatimonadales bacterium]|nr:thioredoxin family protein [Gemmatimonadales bacterium]
MTDATTTTTTLDFAGLWARALTFEDFVRSATENCQLWEGVYATTKIPAWAIERAEAEGPLRLLVLAEDWCGDAANTVPVVAKLALATPKVELRILKRDEHPEVMDRYLTNGARSIPIVIALDPAFRALGHWGPRPTELQAWVMASKATIPKSELYPQIRRWYARDRGATTVREVLDMAGGGA